MHFERKTLPAASALVSLVLFAISANIVVAALVRVSRDFQSTPAVLANAVAFQFTGFFVASIIGGFAADRIGKKPVLQTACVFLGIGALVWSFADSPATAFSGSFIMGLGGGILESMSSALLADLFPDKRKFYLNMSQVAYCVGAVGGPALMGKLMPAGVSWRVFFLGTTGMAVILFVLYAVSSIPRPQSAQIPSHQAGGERGVVRNLTVILPALLIFLYVTAETGTLTFMIPFLQEKLGAPENLAIYSLSLFWLGMVFGRLACAFLPEHHGYEPVIGGLLLASSGVALALVVVQQWQMSIALFALIGLFYAGTWPLIVGLAVHMAPTGQAGRVVGITVACGSLGCVVAPPMLAPVYASASPEWMYAILAGILFLGFILTMYTAAARRRAA